MAPMSNVPATSDQITSDRRPRPRIVLALLGAVLSITTACGTTGANQAADTSHATSPPTTAPTTVSTNPPDTTLTTTPTPASSPAPTTTSAATATRPTATVDELIGAQGERVYVRCNGSGATTVLLIAGFEGSSDAWAKIEPAISERTRVCVHDRPGTGLSDPAVATATFATQAADLRQMLTTVGEPGPYVVVGHSFGGVEAVTFASEFADEVTGLVLVDASPVAWPEALCAVADDGSDAADMIRGFCNGLSDPSGNAEHLDVFAAFAGAGAITSLGSLQMSVITAVDRQLPGLAADEVARLTDAWNLGQQQWGHLSSASRMVPVADTSHDIQLDHPDVVVDEIVRFLP